MAFTWTELKRMIKTPYSFPGDRSLSDIETGNIETNSTIKPIDREDANVELEKGEYVLQMDGNIYKVLGDSHKGGGTPAKLPMGSFVYSDFADLAIDEEDKELFEFKKGGKWKPNKNTPAKVLAREVDTEHHNKIVAVMSSNEHDDVSKKSAALMLKKNYEKFGQVAYLQEEGKGFPEGIPKFAEGTAPYQTFNSIDADAMEKQFRRGGSFIPKYQLAGSVWAGDKYSGRKNASAYSQDEWDTFAKRSGFQGSIGDFQKFLYADPNYKPIIDDLHQQHLPDPYGGMFDSKLGYRWDAVMRAYKKREMDNAQPVMTQKPLPPIGMVDKPGPARSSLTFPTGDPTIPAQEEAPAPEQEEGDILPYQPNVGFSPWQLGNIGYAAFNAATIGKYVPKRAQYDFNPVNLEKINAQPYLNKIDNEANRAYQTNNALNPILARSNNSQIYGQSLDKSAEVLGDIDNRNIQISNQENLYNNQGDNRTNALNVNADQNYYDAVQRVEQNYEREVRTARNHIVSLANMYKSSNDELELNLASQPLYGSKEVFKDPVSGKIYNSVDSVPPRLRNRVVRQRQAAPVYDWDPKSNSIYHTGVKVDLNMIPGNQNGISDVVRMANMLKEQGFDDEAAVKAAAYYLRTPRTQQQQ